MKLLVLGGTRFLGRHLANEALAAGHQVTLFNRGQSNPDLFPEVERLTGNRDGGLEALRGRRWDLAIDTCGYVPRVVRASAELLAGAAEHYTFISSISVYADMSRYGMDESAPVGRLEDETVEKIDGQTYGPLKALCEQAAEAAMPGRVLHVRPGLIVGPHDPTDRFTYWPVRVARGGEVLAVEPELPVQVIDARDLAAWTLQMAAAGRTGIYNATGPASPLSMQSFLQTCREATTSDASYTWVSPEFLLEQKVSPWMELPLWVPPSYGGMTSVNVNKAIGAGLTFRPLAETVRDTLAWAAGRPAETEPRAGLKPERERELLAAWHARIQS